MAAVTDQIHWLSTKEASERLGITLRSLYRFIDEGDLVAYKFGRWLTACSVASWPATCRPRW
jgi:excisionase family DNA binding protein